MLVAPWGKIINGHADENGSQYTNPYGNADTETAFRTWATATTNAALLSTTGTFRARVISIQVAALGGDAVGKIHFDGSQTTGDDSNVLALFGVQSGRSEEIPIPGEVGAYATGVQCDVDWITGGTLSVLLKYQLQRYP